MDIENLTVEEIRDLQASLQDKLKQKEATEKQDLINTIKDLIAQSRFELSDVVAILQQGVVAKNVQYQHPTNPTQTWSGRGRMPLWLHELIEKGNKKEDFFMG